MKGKFYVGSLDIKLSSHWTFPSPQPMASHPKLDVLYNPNLDDSEQLVSNPRVDVCIILIWMILHACRSSKCGCFVQLFLLIQLLESYGTAHWENLNMAHMLLRPFATFLAHTSSCSFSKRWRSNLKSAAVSCWGLQSHFVSPLKWRS